MPIKITSVSKKESWDALLRICAPTMRDVANMEQFQKTVRDFDADKITEEEMNEVAMDYGFTPREILFIALLTRKQ